MPDEAAVETTRRQPRSANDKMAAAVCSEVAVNANACARQYSRHSDMKY